MLVLNAHVLQVAWVIPCELVGCLHLEGKFMIAFPSMFGIALLGEGQRLVCEG